MYPTLYQQHEQNEPPVTLLYIVTILFKHKWLISFLFIGVVGLVTLISIKAPPMYRARSKFMIEKQIDSEKALLFQMNIPAQFEKYDWVYSEIEIIRCYPVAKSVVESLKLADRFSKIYKNSPNDSALRLDWAIKNLQRRMYIDAAKNTNVIEISYQDTDPVMAARVVNSIIPTYETYRAYLYDESETYDFLEQQMQITDENLRVLERHQSEFKSSREMISPEAQRNILLTRLSDFEKRLSELQTTRRRKAAILNIVIDQVKRGDGINSIVFKSEENPARFEHLQNLRNDLVNLELSLEVVLQKFTPEYEEAKNLEKQISATRGKIDNELEQIIEMEKIGLDALAAEENIMRQSIIKTMNEIKNLAQKEYEFTQLSRGIDDTRDIYSALLKQREEARISKAKRQKDMSVKVITPAVIPLEPENKRIPLKISIAVILGLFLGVAFSFFSEYLNHTFIFPEDLERYSHLITLGSIRHYNKVRLPKQYEPRRISHSQKYLPKGNTPLNIGSP